MRPLETALEDGLRAGRGSSGTRRHGETRTADGTNDGEPHRERATLEQWARRRTTPQGLAQRARSSCRAAGGSNADVAAALRITGSSAGCPRRVVQKSEHGCRSAAQAPAARHSMWTVRSIASRFGFGHCESQRASVRNGTATIERTAIGWTYV